MRKTGQMDTSCKCRRTSLQLQHRDYKRAQAVTRSSLALVTTQP